MFPMVHIIKLIGLQGFNTSRRPLQDDKLEKRPYII